MDNQATILLNPDYATPTSIFLIVLSKWGSEFCESNSDPNHFLSQIEVTCVMHNKMPNEPEHEYLVVETQDRLGKIKSLILERTVGSADNTQDVSPGEGFLKLSKRLTQIACDTMISSSQPSYLTSMEEGTVSHTLSSLSPWDKVTVSSTRSADLLAESFKDNLQKLHKHKLDDLHDSPAFDQFLGENYVFSQKWHGQNVRHLKPMKKLSLFELAVLADVVHNEFPKYKLLKEQCYFFAGLIYSAIEYRFGVASSSSHVSTNQELVQIENSQLTNRYGRYNGVLVSNVEHQDVVDIVLKYEIAYALEIAKVTLQSFRLQLEVSSTTIFFIDHESKTDSVNNHNHHNHNDDDHLQKSKTCCPRV